MSMLTAAVAVFRRTTGLSADVLPCQRGSADTVVAVTANRHRVLFRSVLRDVDRFEIADGLKSHPRGKHGTALLVAPYLKGWQKIEQQSRT